MHDNDRKMLEKFIDKAKELKQTTGRDYAIIIMHDTPQEVLLMQASDLLRVGKYHLLFTTCKEN